MCTTAAADGFERERANVTKQRRFGRDADSSDIRVPPLAAARGCDDPLRGPLHTFSEMETLDDLIRVGPMFALKFAVATLCGAMVGLERELAGKAAGLRTNLLICLGSMLFTEASHRLADAFGGDSTRVAAQIVTGIGFIGAGVILHNEHGGVKGLTTAALIWMMAAVGMLIGAGFLMTSVLVTVGTVVVAIGLNPIERWIIGRNARAYRVEFPDRDDVRGEVMLLIQDDDDLIPHYTVERTAAGEDRVGLEFEFVGSRDERRRLLDRLQRIDGANIQQVRAGH